MNVKSRQLRNDTQYDLSDTKNIATAVSLQPEFLFLYLFIAYVHSPVRYIPAPRIGRARVGIEPGTNLVSSASPRAGVHGNSLTHGVPGSPAQPSAGYSTSPHWPGYGEHSTRLGRLGAQELLCACMVWSTQCHLHSGGSPPHQAVSPSSAYRCSRLSSAARAFVLSSAARVSRLS